MYVGKSGWYICGLGKLAMGASVWKFWVQQRVKIESFWVVVGLFLPVQGCVSRAERQGLRAEGPRRGHLPPTNQRVPASETLRLLPPAAILVAAYRFILRFI